MNERWWVKLALLIITTIFTVGCDSGGDSSNANIPVADGSDNGGVQSGRFGNQGADPVVQDFPVFFC